MMIIMSALLTVLCAVISSADDSALWTTTVTPDALIILDNSGSMAEMPQGSSATFYLYGSTNCNGATGPFYTNPNGSSCLNATSLYGFSCTGSGPFTTMATSNLPTGNLTAQGSVTCSSFNGPFYSGIPANIDDNGANISTVYASSSSNCTSSTGGPYYLTSQSGYTYACAISNLPSTNYASNCTNGPWYRTSGSGHGTTCYKTYTTCTTPFSGSANAWVPSSCTTGPWYRTSGSGHTTSCGTDGQCSTSTICGGSTSTCILYSASDCTNGPFYTSSSATYPTACYASCNNVCTLNSQDIPWSTDYADSSLQCSGPYYTSSGTGHTTNCSKIQIAHRALFALLDADSSNTIDSADMTTLGMRLAFMRYYNCSSSNSALAYTNSSSCINLLWGLTLSDNTTTTPYSDLYCGNSTSCASTVTACSGSTSCIIGTTASGGTPLANAIGQATNYLITQKGLDSAASCRQKSIIVITDGADTFSCSGDGSSTNLAQRIASVYYAYQAAQVNKFKVYVIGFGSQPQNLQNILNWMAYYGGTRNPNVTQSGSTTAVTVSSSACSGTSANDPNSNFLTGYAFLANSPADLAGALATSIGAIEEGTYSFSTQASVPVAQVQGQDYLYEASFEPQPYAGKLKEPFWPGHLKKHAITSTGAVQTSPLLDTGAVLRDTDPGDRNMWTYKGNGSAGSALTAFTTSIITAADLGISASNTQTVASVVGFYRGESAWNLENWKFGDPYHSNPVLIGTPDVFFYDPRECGSTSYTTFRTNHTRTIANGNQVVVIGSNDAQFHAFVAGTSTTDGTQGGQEQWSFIPPNLLQNLAPIAHYSHADRPDLSAHALYVDGPVVVNDAWLPSAAGSGTSKNSSDWHTLAIVAEGGGSGNYLWSSSAGCYSSSASAFSATYSSSTPYYCGLYALDVTNPTSTPLFQFIITPTSSQGPYLGQAWSKMQIGRVKINGNEKWVGFIGGGYDPTSCESANGTQYTCSPSATDGSAGYTPGKGFFVVDLTNGSILWSYTHANNSLMNFSTPAAPYAVDRDNDGFTDTVYLGDLGGNIWRFRLCPKDNCAYCGASSYNSSPCTSCGTANWTGTLFYQATDAERGSGLSTPDNTHKQIYTAIKGTIDTSGNWWIYWGTGQRNDPTAEPDDESNTDTIYTKNRLYGVKETNLTCYETSTGTCSGTPTYLPVTTYPTFHTTDLTNVTSTLNSTSCSNPGQGWYYNLSTNSLTGGDGTVYSNPVGEKMISDPTIAGSVVYFPTYLPAQVAGSACGLAGNSFMYKINYLTGCGACACATSCPSQCSNTALCSCATSCLQNNANSCLTIPSCCSTSSVQWMGVGVASAVLASYSPGLKTVNIYATTSGGAGQSALTQQLSTMPGLSNANNLLFWKDERLQ